MGQIATRVCSPYTVSGVALLVTARALSWLYLEGSADIPTMVPFRLLLHSVTPPSVPSKHEKCYDPHDKTLKFVNGEDDLDFLCEDFKSLRAQMSCGHTVTPTSLTNWCRRLLDQGESRFVCGGSGCGAEWTFAEVCKMALLDPQEREYFQKTMASNAARKTLTIKMCPGCKSAVTRENGSDLNVLCKVCTAVKGRPFEFCWQCLKEWKGARPRKDRAENDGCCNQSLETLKKCPDITFDSVEEVHGCPSVRACPTCGFLVEHSKRNCKFVVCPRCKVKFCFVCLKSYAKCIRTSDYFGPCLRGVAPRQTSLPAWQKK